MDNLNFHEMPLDTIEVSVSGMPYTEHKESRVIRPALSLSSGPGGDYGRLPAVRRLAFLRIIVWMWRISFLNRGGIML